jgi:hypothetical protein
MALSYFGFFEKIWLRKYSFIFYYVFLKVDRFQRRPKTSESIFVYDISAFNAFLESISPIHL